MTFTNLLHNMALSHKDWELPNSRIWLAEMNIFKVKKLQTKMQNHWLFSSNNIYFCKWRKSWWEKKVETEQNLKEWNSAHCRSEAKCQLVQTSYIKQIRLFLFLPYNKHLINRAQSICMGESWPQLCVQTSLRSVCTYDLGQDSLIQTSCSVNKS